MNRNASAGPAGTLATRRTLAAEIEASGCRALLVVASSSSDPDLAPFVGAAHLGESFLIAPSFGVEPAFLGYLTAMERQEAAATGCRTLCPATLGLPELIDGGLSAGELWAELLRRGLEAAEVVPGRVAVAGRRGAGTLLEAARSLSEAGWELVDGSSLMRRLRKSKSGGELAEARRVAAATVAAFERVAELLAASTERQMELWLNEERLTGGQLRGEIAVVLARHQLEQPEGNILAAAEDSAVPHTRGSDDRVLRAGESLIVDLFPRGRLFADCTRTFCVGEPPAALAAAHATVLEVLECAYRQARVGASGWELQSGACEVFEEAGYDTVAQDPATLSGYVHGLGHGVGYELHELPSFRRAAGGAEGRLAIGDLFTLEPGLYDPEGGWGVRLEDFCRLGPAGLENLTPAPYDLNPRAWIT